MAEASLLWVTAAVVDLSSSSWYHGLCRVCSLIMMLEVQGLLKLGLRTDPLLFTPLLQWEELQRRKKKGVWIQGGAKDWGKELQTTTFPLFSCLFGY